MFKPHAQCEERKRSAVTLIKLLLADRKPEVLSAHYRELLSILLWKITEAECSNKHQTRFQSQGALDSGDKSKLRHDHVFQRSKMIVALEKAAPQGVGDILNTAVACTVTVEEHARLSQFDDEYGWERYRKAEITVIDTQTGKPLL
ncbi:MAG: hypothetical protein ABSG72_21705 [Candidatus Sulfotelmatobacter sp.]|jgi:hypothetical protein